jgi:type IV secretory pathway VirB4 component
MAFRRKQSEREFDEPAVCDLLPVRDYLDNVMVRTSGALVAGFALQGAMSYFADDEGRNEKKRHLEALLRTVPEESMRLQFRFEVAEDLGTLLDTYERETRTTREGVLALQHERVAMWREKEESGAYLRRMTHLYLEWNPDKHHEVMAASGANPGKRKPSSLSLSTRQQIQRTLKEHLDLTNEYESILNGVESAMRTAGLEPRRMTDAELFLETKRAQTPLWPDTSALRLYPESTRYISPREQAAMGSILNQSETYINIDGLLWSIITLRNTPEATYPGILRDLLTSGIPMVLSAQIIIPNQVKVLDQYKKRHKKMRAAQLDSKGNQRVDVAAQVAEAELLKIQQEIIASSTKTAKLSLTVAIRTSKPACTQSEYEQAEREIQRRSQQVLHIMSRMNGARGFAENKAKLRLYLTSLPGLMDQDKREHDLLTTHAADLVPIEMPWEGTPRSPLMLIETPYRQLLPFSPFDPNLPDANMMIAAASGHGKSVLMGHMLLQAAREDNLVSILERGDSYRSMVEYMDGQMISVALDSTVAMNPWDLEPNEAEPSKDQVAFLKNLVRFMIGESPNTDSELLDNILLDAIRGTYARAAMRPSNPIPVLSDLHDELEYYQDESERVVGEARLAATKLRSWVNDGVYANLFDRHTNLKLTSPWVYFNIEQLKDDKRLDQAMSLLIARVTTKRAAGKTGQRSITALEELWNLLQSPHLGPVAEQLWRTARKRNGSVCGISQAVEDMTGTTELPNPFGAGILKNTSTRIIGRQTGNVDVLRTFLGLNETTINEIRKLGMAEKGKRSDFVVAIGEKAETTHSFRVVLSRLEYWILTTFPREKWYRAWWMRKHENLSVHARYLMLAERHPYGLAQLELLPEERSGEVYEGVAA